MAILGTILMIAGGIIALVYWIFILVNAFKESILWGLGSLFISIVGLIYVIMHWELNKKPFLRYLAGAVIAIIGAVLMSMGAEGLESGVPVPVP